MQANRILSETKTSFVWHLAEQERSFCVPKIRRAYKQLNSMAFVANARPEQSDTHSCSLNKGIGCKSRTRNEAGSAAQTKQSGFPKVAVFLKCCFPCRTHPACGENRSFEELSWLREKAEAMRLRKGENPLRMNG